MSHQPYEFASNRICVASPFYYRETIFCVLNFQEELGFVGQGGGGDLLKILEIKSSNGWLASYYCLTPKLFDNLPRFSK